MISQSTGLSGTVCSLGWNKEDADVICRQQGYTGADTYFTLPRSHHSRVVFGIHCGGNESAVEQCHMDMTDYSLMCSTMDDAAVTCAHTRKYICITSILTPTG